MRLISISRAPRGTTDPKEDQATLVSSDDLSLVQALQSGHPEAPTVLFDRYGAHVQRVLVNVLGVDPELPDLLHEVFARALSSINSLKDGNRLKAWIARIAVFTARGCIRSRRRWRLFMVKEPLPEVSAPTVAPEVREAMRCMYEILERLPADERIAFSLRFISGMDLADLAEVCGISLATIKRRLSRAESRFVKHAEEQPALQPWLKEGSRWGSR